MKKAYELFVTCDDFLTGCTSSLNKPAWGEQDGSVVKDISCHPDNLGLIPKTHTRRRELSPTSCSLTSIHVLCVAQAFECAYTYK